MNRIFAAIAFVSLTAHAELTDQQKQVPLEVDAPDASMTKIVPGATLRWSIASPVTTGPSPAAP